MGRGGPDRRGAGAVDGGGGGAAGGVGGGDDKEGGGGGRGKRGGAAVVLGERVGGGGAVWGVDDVCAGVVEREWESGDGELDVFVSRRPGLFGVVVGGDFCCAGWGINGADWRGAV